MCRRSSVELPERLKMARTGEYDRGAKQSQLKKIRHAKCLAKSGKVEVGELMVLV